VVSTNHSVAISLNPIVLTIDPASGKQGETIQATITGNNLGRVTGISVSGSGVAASIREGKTESSLPVQFVISKEAAAGNRTINLSTPEGQFSTSLAFQIIALPPVTANPTSLNIVVGNTGPIIFSIPGPAPSGGVTLSLSSSASTVATVPASATIPQGQTSVQVNITSVGVGTATITADATAYSKVQVPITVANSPLTGYFYRKTITIDHTKVPSTLTNFPVLVSISNDSDLKNHVTSVNGYDLIFMDAGGNKLNHELERWDGSTGTVVAWVRVPVLSSTTDTVIYMWYGNSWVTTSQENKTGVWDANYKGVWHLKEATGANVADSTSNGNTGTPTNSPAQTTGNIDGSLSLNGTTQYTYLGSPPSSLQPANPTVSAWINSTTGSGVILAENPAGADYDGRGYRLYLSSGKIVFFFGDAGGSWITVTGSTALNTGTWHLLTGTYDGSQLKVYVNGVLDGAANTTEAISYADKAGYGPNPQTLYIGTRHNANNSSNTYPGDLSNYFSGRIDEVRISNVARSADWILTEYRNQSSPSTFYTAGSEEVNHAPAAQNQSVTTNQDTAKAITLVAMDSDGDPLTYQIVTQPGHGMLSGTPPNVTYTPAAGYSGSDTFTFKANDGNLDGNVATVSISVVPNLGYQKTITIDHTKVPSTLSDFPVLISITNDNDLKNHVMSANGYDLIFMDASGNQLPHEVERWDGTTGTLVAWVKVPALSSTADTVISMQYGKNGVTTSQENKTGVWKSNFKGVWHLPNGSTLTANDSTGNGNNGTNYGVTAAAGKIDGGGNFNGGGKYVDVGAMPAIQGSSRLIISMWIYQSSYQATAYIYKNANDGILFQPWNDQRIYFAINGIGSRAVTNAGDAPLNSWFNLVGVYDGSNIIIYINGQQKATSPKTTTIPTDGAHILIGNNPGMGTSFIGLLDEVRISDVGRSAGWILAEYRNQSSPSTFYTVGSEELIGTPVNHAPVAQSQSVTAIQDTAKAITLAATDSESDPLTYQIVAQPGHGTLSGTPPNVTYTPAAGYSGPDSFTFKANDGMVDSNVATISITVTVNGVLQDIYSNGGAFTWICPQGVTSVDVEVRGGGGAGGFSGSSQGSGGGGGGAYSRKTGISVTPGQSYTVVVGKGADQSVLFGGNTLTNYDGGGSGNTNILRACKYSLSEAAVITAIKAYFTNVSGSYNCYVTVSIYSDDNGYPGSKLGESGVYNIQQGGYTLFQMPATALAAGTYWLVTNCYVNTSLIGRMYYGSGSSNQEYSRAGSYGGTIPSGPSTFPSGATGADNALSIYAVRMSGGDSYFIDVSAVLAKGGTGGGGPGGLGGSGGDKNSGVGDVKYSGGNGAAYYLTTQGGGGGRGAGDAADGGNANGELGGPGGAFAGGNGGNGGITSSQGVAGSAPGGGGGGASAYSGGLAGGNGGDGNVVLIYGGSPGNHAPVAQNQSLTMTQDTAKAITLVATDADNDPLTYQIVAQPGHGTLSGTPPNVTYTPAAGYSGPDSFTFKANDAKVDGNVATISISIVGSSFTPTITDFRPIAMETDGSYLYISGIGYIGALAYHRIEKRDLNGNLVDQFDQAIALPGYLSSLKLDNTNIYVGGYRTEAGVEKAIIQKRDKNNLSSQSWEYVYSGSNYEVRDLVLFGDGVYFSGAGQGGTPVLKGKVNQSDGTQVWVFANTYTASDGISTDGSFIYLHERASGYATIEKVNPINGSVLGTKDYSPGNFSKGEIVDGYLYVAGNINTLYVGAQALVQKVIPAGNSEWQIAYPTVPGGSTNVYDKAICDGPDVYVVGRAPASAPGPTTRIAKHSTSNGAEIWGVNHPTTTKASGGFCHLGAYLYVAGWDRDPTKQCFWLEKRNKLDGSLIWAIP